MISAVTFAQFAFVAVAMLAVTGEYASGGIRVTLQATPVRGARARGQGVVLVPVMLVAGVLSGGAAAVAVYLFLSFPRSAARRPATRRDRDRHAEGRSVFSHWCR